MPITDWIALLALQGDPYERDAASLGLIHKFSRYAEFWGRFIFPNRDLSAPAEAKLKSGFSVEIEDIYNLHYSVLYHFSFAHAQVYAIKSNRNLPVEVGDPLYHLATACDLIERLLLNQLLLTGRVKLVELTRSEFDGEVESYWDEQYQKQFNRYAKEAYRSVSIPLHSQERLISQELQHYSDFKNVADEVRQYRNVFTHSISPLRLILDGKIYIPKRNFIGRYKRWSAGRDQIDRSHFAEAVTVIEDLIEEIITKSNALWLNAIEMMDTIASMEKYRSAMLANTPLPYPETRHFPEHDDGSVEYTDDIGGSAVYKPPPLFPSGYKP